MPFQLQLPILVFTEFCEFAPSPQNNNISTCTPYMCYYLAFYATTSRGKLQSLLEHTLGIRHPMNVPYDMINDHIYCPGWFSTYFFTHTRQISLSDNSTAPRPNLPSSKDDPCSSFHKASSPSMLYMNTTLSVSRNRRN